MNSDTARRCWLCKFPIEEVSTWSGMYKPTGEQIEAHRECMERVRCCSEERERFARARLTGFVASLPAFSVRHDSPEFAERVTHSRLIAAAERYELKHGNVGFVGPSGCGKSTVAADIALGLVEDAVIAYRDSGGRDQVKLHHALGMRWTTAAELCVARKQHKLGEGEAPDVERAENATLLFLDELGQEIADDRWLLEFMNVRYARQLPTITTSGLTQIQLESRYGVGAHRRLVEPRGIFVDLFEGSKPRLVGLDQRAARGG